MRVKLPLSTPGVSALPAVVSETVTTTFDERWEAWLARGAGHDRAVRRKIAIAAPVMAVVVVAVLLIR